jgi:hypothetical protein
MPPQALALAFFLIEEGIKLEPGLAEDLRNLFTKADPTPEDWAALRAKVTAKSYADYVPASALTAATPPAATPVLSVVDVQAPPPAPSPEPAPLEETPAPTAAPAPVFTGQAVDPHA